MRSFSLLLLRVSIGVLMLLWGADKLVDVEHGLNVTRKFYLGLLDSPGAMQAFGVLQCLLGLLVVVGALRRLTYPALLLVTGATALGVWRSIVDPWGWYLEGSNVLFYPSLITFAGVLVLMAFQPEDEHSVDQARAARRSNPLSHL